MDVFASAALSPTPSYGTICKSLQSLLSGRLLCHSHPEFEEFIRLVRLGAIQF
jgi:hypothetical protein